MEKLKRSLSIRKKKVPRLESSKPHQWQEDERKVRDGTCSFQVKYLGCVEVYESRGIQICEEAVKVLKAKKSRSAWSRLSFRKKKDDSQQPKSGHHRAILYVTGDALRVVDEISKGLIVDQTIEKVSFCAPDRNHERGFAYICRDGTTRRWLCHGFFAIKESGERLSHAVGCAFGICLEKKQQREKEKVSVTYNENGTSFTRMGSFRQTTLTERLTDPQSAIVAEPVPFKPTEMPFAVQRPHAPANILDRQGSFRGFNKLAESSPFKRNTSLRVNELPSTLERQKQFSGIDGPQLTNGKTPIISTIIEDEELPPSMLEEPSGSQWPVLDSFSSLKLNNSVPVQTTAIIQPPPPVAQSTVQPPYSTAHGSAFTGSESLQLKNSQIVTSLLGNMPAGNSHIENPQLGVVVKQTNPWAAPKPQESRSSEAENWLNSTANRIDPFAAVPPPCAVGVSRQRSVNSFGGQGSVATATSLVAPFQAAPTHESHHMAQAHVVYPSSVAAVPVVVQHQIVADPRFQPAVDRSWMTGSGPSLAGGAAASPGSAVEHSTAARGSMFAPSSASVAPVGAGVVPSTDPFDSAWAARATAKSANPFHPAGASFQVKI